MEVEVFILLIEFLVDKFDWCVIDIDYDFILCFVRIFLLCKVFGLCKNFICM